MTTYFRVIAAAATALAAAGCALPPRMTDAAYPVYGNPVNPTPVPGYRVECRSVPSATFFLSSGFTTGCRQIIVPREHPVVVQASG